MAESGVPQSESQVRLAIHEELKPLREDVSAIKTLVARIEAGFESSGTAVVEIKERVDKIENIAIQLERWVAEKFVSKSSLNIVLGNYVSMKWLIGLAVTLGTGLIGVIVERIFSRL